MTDQLLRQIDFSRYQRWFDRSLGYACPIKVLGAAGNPFWGCNNDGDAELGRLVAQASRKTNGVQRLDINAHTKVLYRQLGPGGPDPRGFAAVVANKLEASADILEIDRVADALDDLASGIGDELEAKADLDKVTEELAECYEELHLVYSLDRHNRISVEHEADSFQKMLQDTSAHLNVDVVAFVRPRDDLCMYATSLSREINNLDLVLVEMRGDLFRFIQSSCETLVLNEESDPRRSYIFTDMPYRVLACPIRTGRRVDALVVLLNHMHKPPFTNSDMHLGEVLANQVSAMVNQVLMLDSSAKFTKQLVMAMVETVEAKDPYTRGHSERVNHLSVEIGKALGLAEEELLDLHWGSLLHDVGKIGIPDVILCKSAMLTKDEYTFIMVHSERSYEILRHIDQLKGALPGARHHHERWDGNGYPHGLAGERIPLHARIMAVADTYDSITSSRAYRAGRPHELAMAEIARASGTQLDPSMVKTFAKICKAEPEWLKRFNILRERASPA
ncbi:cyclic di-GMP phosphodiesterase response regulator RpfG [mine drainage metagenome]|uniref:Cyclic di-GMP phosphodiesterase response regulator RpfG n=1 Tax=mine drainage metagenome TaxID=410659 RepID=A0A1J5RK83_9ZZZZ